MMVDDKSAIREVVVAVKAADSPSFTLQDEHATEKNEDQAEHGTSYLTGLRLTVVAVTYVQVQLIGCPTELH